MKNKTNLWTGIFLILLGILFLVNQLGIFDNFISMAWPLIFLFLAVINLTHKNFVGTAIFFFLWVMLQSSTIIGWSLWGTLWPLILIFIGLAVIFQKSFDRIFNKKIKDKKIEEFLILSGKNISVEDEKFEGGSISAILGGAELNLRKVNNKIELNLLTFLGGIEIALPSDYTVENEMVMFLGGVSDNRKIADKSKDKILRLTGTAVLGGVDIREKLR